MIRNVEPASCLARSRRSINECGIFWAPIQGQRGVLTKCQRGKRGSATGLPSLPHTVKEGTKAGSTALSWLSRLAELLFTLLCTLRNEAPRNLLTFPTNITCRIKVSPTHTPNCLRHLSRARRGVYFLFLFTFPHARECCGGGSCLPSFLPSCQTSVCNLHRSRIAASSG